MSPVEKVVELSGNTRVAMPIYTLIAVAMSLLGIRAMGIGQPTKVDDSIERALEKNTAAVQAFAQMTADLPRRVHALEVESAVHGGMIRVNTDDIKGLEDRMIDRSWTGFDNP